MWHREKDERGKIIMRRCIAIIMFLSFASIPALCFAECLTFKCQGVGEGIIWKYTFEVDRDTATGVEKGVTLAGYPYTKEIEVAFTPERMQIRSSGEQEFAGWIDRGDLSFSYGWANGSCDIIPAEKKDTKF